MMTVMLIRRHPGRSTTTTNYPQQQQEYQQEEQEPCITTSTRTSISVGAAYQLHRRHRNHHHHHHHLHHHHHRQHQTSNISADSSTASTTNPDLFGSGGKSDGNVSIQQQHRYCKKERKLRHFHRRQTEPTVDCMRYYPGAKSLKAAFRMTYYNTPARAMRYYRIWIYTCNAVLFVCVIGFIIVACKIIVADPRRSLVPDFDLTHPSLLYAYFALVMQSGFLQMIGCVGARTLNERLLNLYWLLLLLLLIGDAVLGVFWFHHYEHIASQIKPVLKERFRLEYGADERFTDLWNMVQKQDQCCGVENYEDFYLNNSVRWAGTSTMDDGKTSLPTVYLPPSCCGGFFEHLTSTSTIKAPEARRNTIFSTSSTTTVPPLPPIFSTAESITVTDHVIADGIIVRCNEETALFYTAGCEKRLSSWFRSSLDILFVLGYCVISFIKLCFLGILRYEIREMIQKIKILQTELKNTAEMQDTASIGLQKLQQIRRYDHNGSVVGVAQPLLDNTNRDSRGGSIITVNDEMENNEDHEASANSPLLRLGDNNRQYHNNAVSLLSSPLSIMADETTDKRQQKDIPPMHLNLISHQRHLSSAVGIFNQQDAGGNDSDTNSHCALLITDEKIPPSSERIKLQKASSAGSNSNRNNSNNSNYESHELQQLDKLRMSKNRAKT